MIENDDDIRFVDTSEITDFSFLFQGKTNFNQDLSRWNTSSVTDMSNMFFGAEFFNQILHNFDTSNATDMSYMFFKAKSFNKNFENYGVKNSKNIFKGLKFFHKLNNIKTLYEYIYVGHPECYLDKQLFQNVDFLDIDNDFLELSYSDTNQISNNIDFNGDLYFVKIDKKNFIYDKNSEYISETKLDI